MVRWSTSWDARGRHASTRAASLAQVPTSGQPAASRARDLVDQPVARDQDEPPVAVGAGVLVVGRSVPGAARLPWSATGRAR